ncbi:hypothetical protein MASR2M48_34990 [Spirochaetota bacterium]
MVSKGSRIGMMVAWSAFAVMAAFMVWAFFQEGTLGMYRWGYRAPVLALCALGILPLVVGMVLRHTSMRSLQSQARASGISISISAVSLVVGLGIAIYLFSNAYGAAVATQPPVLIDPAQGFKLRTGVDGGASFRVALSSDAHYGRDVSNATARSAILRRSQTEYEQGRLDAFFNLGDTVEMGMDASDWKEALTALNLDAPSLPFLMLMGNHDGLIGGGSRWRAAFAPGSGKRGIPAGGLSASSWRMDSGPVHFIALDLLWGPEGFGTKEKDWLSMQLESIPSDEFIVVLSHCFFYSSGYIDEGTGKAWYDHEEMIRDVAPLIEGKVDLVVSGHNHYMEWLETDGSAWAVVGVLGGIPDPEPSYVSPHSVWFKQGVFGRLILELLPEGLACEFQDETGQTLFQKTVTKH